MNASERLQAIIKARLEGERFDWGPGLAVWGTITVIRMLMEIAWGPTLVGGSLAYGLILVFQLVWPRWPGVRAPRGWALPGLWTLIAAAGWFFGSVAPAMGWMTPLAGGVLELTFLAGGLAQTGIIRARGTLLVGGAGLALAAIALGVFPGVLPIRCGVVALAFGLPLIPFQPRKVPKEPGIRADSAN